MKKFIILSFGFISVGFISIHLFGQQMDWNTQIKNRPGIYTPGSKMKCDGTTDDHVALQNALNVTPYGGMLEIPPTTHGCVISANVTIPVGITLSAFGPGSPKAQLLQGVNGITLLTINSLSSIRNISIDGNSKTGGTGININTVNNIVIDNVLVSNMATSIYCTATVFTTIKDTRLFNIQSYGINATGQCNSIKLDNVSIYGNAGAITTGVSFTNSESLAISGLTLEAGAVLTTYNSNGVSWSGGYTECGADCPAAMATASYITIGAFFGNSPTNGVSITGLLNNGTVGSCLTIGYAQGITYNGNTCLASTNGIVVVTSPSVVSTYALNQGDNFDGNNWGTITESNILVFSGSGNNNTTASNVTRFINQPLLFSTGTPVPQTAHVPLSDSAIFWAQAIPTAGAQPDIPARLSMLNNVGGVWYKNFMIDQFECVPQALSPGNGGSCYIDGNLSVRPYGLLNTKYVSLTLDNTHRVSLIEESAAGGTYWSGASLPYAAILSTNDNYPIQFGTGANYRGGFLTTGAGWYIVPVAFSGLGTCNAGTEGSSVPITNSNTNTPGATISGTGTNHGYAHCNGTNWVFAF